MRLPNHAFGGEIDLSHTWILDQSLLLLQHTRIERLHSRDTATAAVICLLMRAPAADK